jgi:iron complex outermembrane receptor protein
MTVSGPGCLLFLCAPPSSLNSFAFLALTPPVALFAQDAPPPPAAQGRLAAPPATGEGLPGANVIFVDLKQGTATGPDGRFRFSSLPCRRFTGQVRSLGYNTVTQTVGTGN